MTDPHSMHDVLDELDELAETHERVSIGDALDDFGNRSFGVFLVILPFIEFSPVGGIPGVPTAVASVIALIAVQLLLRRDHVWLPRFVEKRSISSKKLHKAVEKLDGLADFFDRCCNGRLSGLVNSWSSTLAALCILLLCLLVPPLEFVPFASSGPMLAIVSFGLALLVRDGLLMLIAILLTTTAVGGGAWLVISNGFQLPF